MTLVHLMAMCAAFVFIVCADNQAVAWMRGAKQTLDKKTMHWLHSITWVALILLVVSGVWLLSSRTYLLSEPWFILKLLFVGMLVTNAVLIGRLMPVAFEHSYASRNFSEKLPLFVSAFVSTVSWLGIMALAYYLFWPWIS